MKSAKNTIHANYFEQVAKELHDESVMKGNEKCPKSDENVMKNVPKKSQGDEKHDEMIMEIGERCPESDEKFMTEQYIREVYEEELMNIRISRVFMGIRQFHMAAEILRRPIGLVYLSGTNPRVCSHLNRIILPADNSLSGKTVTYIMWTSLHLYSCPYDIKHFLPLMMKQMHVHLVI